VESAEGVDAHDSVVVRPDFAKSARQLHPGGKTHAGTPCSRDTEIEQTSSVHERAGPARCQSVLLAYKTATLLARRILCRILCDGGNRIKLVTDFAINFIFRNKHCQFVKVFLFHQIREFESSVIFLEKRSQEVIADLCI